MLRDFEKPVLIPDVDFYAFITQQEFRDDARNLLKLGLEKYLEQMSRSDVFLEGRRRAEQDSYFLTRYFTWETNPESSGKTFADNMICEHVHLPLCKMFVKKDKTKSVAEQDTVCKERYILYPRGSFKSTTDVADCVQWILNFPDIRILFLTAADDLAVGFVDETKGHFIERLDDPTLMNIFFPEFCLTEKEMGKETEFQFTCPVWRRQGLRRKEATVMAMSVTSTLSGFHFEVVKADDPVSNRNSESDEQCKKVTKQLNVSVRKMLRPFGYFDGIGTRYADEDYWGEVLEKNVGDLRKTSGPNWDHIENLTTGSKILIGRAWELKTDAKQGLENGTLTSDKLTVEHYHLLFPEVLTFSFLRQEQARDESSFEGQYNQNPRPASATPFTRTLLLKSTVSFQEMPFKGPTSQTWDFAFSKKKGRDYSTGSCAIWNEKGVAFINDLVRGRFHHNDLAKAVVDFARKWHPFIIGIEDAAGSRFLEFAIQDEARKTGDLQVIGVCNRIDWVVPDNQKDAKKMRMASLHPWLINDRMKFASHLAHLEALYSEFERCLTSHHHDDIPDVISRQAKYAPQMAQIIEKNDIQTWSQADASYNLLFEENCDAFGRPGMGGPPQSIDPTPEEDGPEPYTQPGFDPILGGGLSG